MSGFDTTRWSLIHAAQAGDASALESLSLRYRAPVVAYLRRRGFDADAEDLAQEVFLRLFGKGVLDRAARPQGRFRGLLAGLTRNVVGDHLRRRSAKKRGSGEVQALGDRDHHVAAPEEDEAAFDQEWMQHLLSLGLARLEREHPNYHDALKRFHLLREPQADIAAAMGRSVKDVKNYVHRGKKKLGVYLREEIWNYSSAQPEFTSELEHLRRFVGDLA